MAFLNQFAGLAEQQMEEDSFAKVPALGDGAVGPPGAVLAFGC